MSSIVIAAVAVVFAINLDRFWFIGDDAYISFRYADNFVRGNGLLYNPGDAPVEGYTNFLWVMVMALGLLVGIPPETFSLVLGAICGGGVLVMLGWHRWQEGVIALTVPLLLASTRSFTGWCTGGLETMATTILLWSAILLHLRAGSERMSLASAACFGLAVLTRPDAVLFGVIAGAQLLFEVIRGKQDLKRLLAWCVVAAGVVLVHMAFRIGYYGDYVPNTFHAKANGVWWQQGLLYMGLFRSDYLAEAWAWLALVAVWKKPDRTTLFLFAMVAVQVAYVIMVGGDRFEFRFLVPVLPALFWLVMDGFKALDFDDASVLMFAAALGALFVIRSPEVPENARHGVATLNRIGTVSGIRAAEGRRLRHYIDDGRIPDDIRMAVGAAGALPYHARLHALDIFGLSDAHVAKQPVQDKDHLVVAHLRHAEGPYIVEQRVEMWPVGLDLFIDDPAEVTARLKKMERKIADLGVEGQLFATCREIDDTHMVFITTLNPREADARFGLERCRI